MRINLHVKIMEFNRIDPKYVGERLKEGIKDKIIINNFTVYYCTSDRVSFGEFLSSTSEGIFFRVPISDTRLIYVT